MMFLPYDFVKEDEILKFRKFFKNRKNNSLKKFRINIHPVKIKDKRHINLKKNSTNN